MDLVYRIHPEEGFSGLKFGAEIKEALALFGEPEETQTLEDPILKTSSLVYHYWEQEFSLFFDNLPHHTFCGFEANNPESLMFDTRVFDLKEKELVDLLKKNRYLLSESDHLPGGEKILCFDEAGLDFYFQNQKLMSVQCFNTG